MPRTAPNSTHEIQLKCHDLAKRCELILRAQQHMLNLRDKNLIKKLAIHLKAENILDNLHLMQNNFAALNDRHQNILDELAKLSGLCKQLEHSQTKLQTTSLRNKGQAVLPSYQVKL